MYGLGRKECESSGDGREGKLAGGGEDVGNVEDVEDVKDVGDSRGGKVSFRMNGQAVEQR